jgi:hypothetical protein
VNKKQPRTGAGERAPTAAAAAARWKTHPSLFSFFRLARFTRDESALMFSNLNNNGEAGLGSGWLAF